MNEILNINDYLEKCKKTAIYPNVGNNLEYTLFGLSGECGEIMNLWKKNIRDNEGTLDKEIIEKMKYEMGDVFWYLVMMCFELEIKPSEVLLCNIEKLNSRKERGKLSGSGDYR